jgi:uncharacterized protein
LIFKILEEQGCPPLVINHCNAVKNKAVQLSINSDSKTDLGIIETGALLHDIGRSRTNQIDHALVGAQILEELGFPQNVIKIVERHIGAGITSKEALELGLPEKNFIPRTIEEKIVAHADNLISGTKEVSLDFVVKKWNLKPDNPYIKRLYKLHYEVTGEIIIE